MKFDHSLQIFRGCKEITACKSGKSFATWIVRSESINEKHYEQQRASTKSRQDGFGALTPYSHLLRDHLRCERSRLTSVGLVTRFGPLANFRRVGVEQHSNCPTVGVQAGDPNPTIEDPDAV